MNGRVYDAEIGRFLSADIVIQDVTNLQSLNAYSYVLNNPLSFTDPSGFFFKSLFRAIGNFFKSVFRAIGNVFKAVLRSSIGRAIIQVAACTFGGVIGCVAITAALTLATGGSITEALTAAAFSFASAGVWSVVQVALAGAAAVVKVAVHGVVNGALSVAQGGSFLQGFAAGAIGQAGGLASESVFGPAGTGGPEAIAGRTAIAATAGGLGAELTGGKFSNGAVSAAFAHLYNAEGERIIRGFRISLAEHEALGGHTIAKHVGKTPEWIQARMEETLRGPNYDLVPIRWGSFSSLPAAEALVNSTLSLNTPIVDKVIAGDVFSAVIDAVFPSPTGIEGYRPSPRSAVVIRNTYTVRTVIQHAPDARDGFVVVTSYPRQ